MMRSKSTFIPLFTLMFNFFFLLATAQPTVTAEPESVGLSTERLDRLSRFLDKEIEDKDIPGAVSLIFREGEVVYFATHGYQNAPEGSPMPEDAIFYIQSMTKPIISVAIMMLYEEGHFSLKDPVSKYLPQFESPVVAVFNDGGSNGDSEMELVEAEEPITIVQLLTHTAGMLHGLGGTELDRKYLQQLYLKPHKTIADRVEALAGLPLVNEPGDAWHYSAAPDVLALLIEHFSGMSTAEFLQQRIFDPLGMEDTGYNITPEKNGRVATLHQYNQSTDKLTVSPRQTPTQGNTIYGGTHGLFSTPGDYLKFCRMLLNGGAYNGHRLLSPKTIELMTADHVKDRYPEPGYGFGLGFAVRTDLADAQRLGSVGQYSWSGAYNTYFFIDPEEEMIGILMMQMAPYTNFYNYKFQQLVYQAIISKMN
jgi:CubicO group peptidase (beta-lactamase class C family)